MQTAQNRAEGRLPSPQYKYHIASCPPTCGALALHHSKDVWPPCPILLFLLLLLLLCGATGSSHGRCLRLRVCLLRQHSRLQLPAAHLLRQDRLLGAFLAAIAACVCRLVKHWIVVAAHAAEA